MSPLASQITSLAIVCSTVYTGSDQRKHQSSTSLAFVTWLQYIYLYVNIVTLGHKELNRSTCVHGTAARAWLSSNRYNLRFVYNTFKQNGAIYRCYYGLTKTQDYLIFRACSLPIMFISPLMNMMKDHFSIKTTMGGLSGEVSMYSLWGNWSTVGWQSHV